MTAYTARLHEPVQAHRCTVAAYSFAKGHLVAGGGPLVMTVKPANRTLDQSAKFHALCGDIAKSRLPWAGKPRTAAQWKVLLVSGHAVATKEDVEIVPGLESEFVSIRESTALMSVRRAASLIEYSLAFAAMNGVALPALEGDMGFPTSGKGDQ